MATRNIGKDKKPSPQRKKAAAPDKLLKGGKANEAELSEDELKDVSGGPIYVKYDYKG
jgi:hypothetical protein